MLTAHLSLLDGLLHAGGGDGDGGGSGAAARAAAAARHVLSSYAIAQPAAARALLQFTLRHTAPLEAAAAAAAEACAAALADGGDGDGGDGSGDDDDEGDPDDDGVVALARGASGVAGLQLRANASVRSAAVVTSLTLWRSQLQEVANLGGGGVRQPLSLAALVVPLGRGLQSLARSELAAATAPATVGKVLGLVTLLLSTAARGCATVRALSAPRRAGAARAAAGAAAAGGAAAADVAAAWVEAWLGVAPIARSTASGCARGATAGAARRRSACRRRSTLARGYSSSCALPSGSPPAPAARAAPRCRARSRSRGTPASSAAAAPPTRRAARTTTRRRWRRRRRPTTAAAAAARGGGCGARNPFIDAELAETGGNDTFADLEDFIVTKKGRSYGP